MVGQSKDMLPKFSTVCVSVACVQVEIGVLHQEQQRHRAAWPVTGCCLSLNKKADFSPNVSPTVTKKGSQYLTTNVDFFRLK